MKLVIDIPSECIKTDNYANDCIAYFECCTPKLYETLKNSTPLPEGHRGIVDLKEVKWAFDDVILDEARQTGQPRATSEEIAEILKNVPILIPADRSGECI